MAHFTKIFFLTLLTQGYAVDPCYDITSGYGLIGNCISMSSCRSDLIVQDACPSYPHDHVCCFDGNFPGREMRGAWIATVENIDWPLSPFTNVTGQQQSLEHLIDSLELAGINAVYFQVRPVGDALYQSNIEPWSRYLTGTQGTSPDPLWDPLNYLINYASRKNIEVHAWLNPYRANMRASVDDLDPRHMARQFPQFAYNYSTFIWMDPGASAVQNRTYDVVIDLVSRYDLDGIHFDDYFYPYPVAGLNFPDEATYNEYLVNGGHLSQDDWRRDNVNQLMQRLSIGIHALKPWMKFSISPFGIYRPGHPEGMPSSIVGFDQYSQLYCDPKLWLQNGWVDVLQPQLYWRIDPPQQSYPVLLDWWVSINSLNRHVYAGNALYRIHPADNWPISEIGAQLNISRGSQLRSKGSWGNIQFSAKYLRDNTKEEADYFKNVLYPYPAIQPSFPWLANGREAPSPLEIRITDRKQGEIAWDRTTHSDHIHKVGIYKKSSNGSNEWNLYKILGSKETNILLPPGIYAISAVDRFNQESKKVFFSLV